ncbi:MULTISPECIES: phage tail terminator family protein [Lysinibacillus]|uniref:phage tail terminator family protein n=1 Tax=Lysinibacillus TaxID=400634 RepID=UPI0004D890A1|nr:MULTISPECIES: hypothetical protein [Lysinibacillus]AJK89646.1 hypothetical protein HR49_22100 [Lysinibacillus fusiformis]KHK54298.1 hypothetical protein PI85_05710 [Lysinibacillus sp. A1]
MITFKQIKTTINKKLQTNFDMDVSSKAANEGFTRPSFKVELDNVKREGHLTQVEKACTVRIFYFPKDENNSIELLDVQEKLGDLFDLKFSIEDRHLDINEPNFDEIDGVLQFEFDLQFFDGREYENEDIGIEDEIKNGKDFYEKYPIELMGELVEEGD